MIYSKSISRYFMVSNKLLGDCLCLVYQMNKDEIKRYCMSSAEVIIFIKSNKITQRNYIKFFSKKEASKSVFDSQRPILLRISCECKFGMFGDSHCDCESQRISSLEMIKSNGQGIYIHLPLEAKGHGLYYKARELDLQISGYDPKGKYVGEMSMIEASRYLLGSKQSDKRNFEIVVKILEKLNMLGYEYSVLGENQSKLKAIIDKVKIKGSYDNFLKKYIDIHNLGDHLIRFYEGKGTLNKSELQSIINMLKGNNKIPVRVINTIKLISSDLKKGKKIEADRHLINTLINEIC